jgi:hypothetical protein
MRRDDCDFVSMKKFIRLLNPFQPAKHSSKFIQSHIPDVVRAGVALKRKGRIDGIIVIRPVSQDLIIGRSPPSGIY